MAYPVDWGRKCEVVIQSSKVSENLTNFPLLLTEETLPSEMFDADGSYPALNGGGDIRFSSDSEGVNQLACEIVNFVTDNDPANGTAQIFVKVPSVSSSADTTIYVWYNKSGETQPASDDTYGSEAVWADYLAVWKLDESAGSSRNDSTGNDNTLTEVGTVDNATGKIFPQSADFNNSATEYLKIIYASQTGLNPTSAHVYSAWVNFNSANASLSIFYGNYISGSDRGNMFGYSGSTLEFFKAYSASGGDVALATTAWAPTIGTWHHVACVWDSSDKSTKFYVDGVQLGTTVTTANGAYATDNDFYFGNYAGANGPFDGVIEDARYSSTLRSVGWILSEYNNQSVPSTFAIDGTPESPGGGTVIISVSDSIGLAGSINNTRNRTFSVSDSLGMADSFSLVKVMTLFVKDTIGLVDTVSSMARTRVIGVSDSIGLTETISVAKLIIISVSDSIGLTGAISTIRVKVISVSDTIGLSESITGFRSWVSKYSDRLSVWVSKYSKRD